MTKEALHEVRLTRRVALDGLRGSAALVVVLFHASLELPNFSVSTYTGTLLDLILFTPLRVLFLGGEAVHLFFVLSGFTLPFLLKRLRPHSWRYLASRAVRLFVPAWAALLLFMGTTLALGLNSGVSPDFGPWQKVLRDFILVLGPQNGTDWILGVLWSMAFEIIFSLSLFIWFPLLKRGNGLVWFTILVCLITLGDVLNSGLMQYLPMFLIGVVLFHRAEAFESLIRGIQQRAGRVALTVTALVLVSAIYLVGPALRTIVPTSDMDLENLKLYFYLPQFLGVCLIVGLALWESRWNKVFSSPILAWLGRVSFSLYLVHQSVLITGAAMSLAQPWRLLLEVVASLAAAQIFFSILEKRVHSMARKIAGHRND